MDTFEKFIKSWWVLFPFTLFLPGFGFIYIGLKSSNRNWILEGVTYQLPFFFYFVACAIYPADAMIKYYIWLILLAAFIALIRSIMVAIKLIEQYEKEERPKISASTYTSSNPSSSADATVKKDKDSKLPACCACLVFIFVIFAIISIL